MRAYILRRLLVAIPVVVAVSLVSAALIRLAPGDAVVEAAARQQALLTQEEVEKVRTELGLDKNFFQQYGSWVAGIFRGDLGTSFAGQNQSVVQLLKRAIPVSAELAILATIFALIIAIPVGVVSAIRQDTFWDYSGRMLSIAGLSVPDFIIATMLIIYTAIWFNWNAVETYASFIDSPAHNLRVMSLPAAIIGVRFSSITARIIRSSMLEVLREDYIRTAWSKGLHEWVVVFRHALKNAFIPVFTVIGSQFTFLLGGAVIVEQIFGLPGMGKLTLDSILQKDFPTIQIAVLVIAAAVVVMNLAVDMAYGWFDPRIRYGAKS